MRSALSLAVVLAACASAGRQPARTAMDQYQAVAHQTCECAQRGAPDCARDKLSAWIQVGVDAQNAHARFTEAESQWLLHLGIDFNQCLAKARGEPVDLVDY